MTEADRIYRAILAKRLADIARHLLAPDRMSKPPAVPTAADIHPAHRRIQ